MDQTAEGREALQPQLLPGEQVTWSGTSKGRHLFEPGDLLLVPFSLMWGGFAIFWEAAAISSHEPFFVLWGVPFVLIGQYQIWGRLIVRRRLRAHTLYVLTDRRVLVSSRSIFGAERLQACFLDQVPALNLHRRRDGSGTIEFGSSSEFGGRASMFRGKGLDFMSGGRGAQPVPAFSDILDVDRVYELASRARNEAFGARSR